MTLLGIVIALREQREMRYKDKYINRPTFLRVLGCRLFGHYTDYGGKPSTMCYCRRCGEICWKSFGFWVYTDKHGKKQRMNR